MTVPPSTPDLDALLAHSGWVRALARNLVVDPFAAEDAEQQAWVTALENPPKHGGNLRSWWGAVVRSSAGKGWREQKRRREVTHGVALEEAPSAAVQPDAVAEKLDTFQRLALAVSQLPEPYRTVIYLRYIEELSVREIAKRQSVPVPTAQSHIQRGLEKLRATLADNIGAQWRNRCLVFALPLPAAPWLSLGPAAILVMKTKTILGVAAAILGLACLAIWAPWDNSESGNNSLPLADAELDSDLIDSAAGKTASIELEDKAASSVVTRVDQLGAAVTKVESFEVQLVDAQTLEPLSGGSVFLADYALRDEEQKRYMRAERPDNLSAVLRFGVEHLANVDGIALLPLPSGRHQLAARAENRFGYQWSFEQPQANSRVQLMMSSEVQLSVEVKTQSGQPVEGARVGFEAVRMLNAGFASREVRTNALGTAVFHHLETDVMGRDQDLFTFALMVPSAIPQVQEVRADTIADKVLQFTMPETGNVTVEVINSDGTIPRNGVPIVLQVADESAHLVAAGKTTTSPGGGFDPRLKQGTTIAYVREGVATFEGIGVGVELVAATYSRAYQGYSVAISDGPKQPGETTRMSLVVGGAMENITLQMLGENQQPLASGRLSSRLSWINEEQKPFGLSNPLQVEEGGLVTLRLPSRVKQAGRCLFTTEARIDAWIGADPTKIELGITILEDTPFQESDVELTVSHAAELLVSGTVVDQDGKPYPGCPLALSIREGGDQTTLLLMERWNLKTDENGYFEIRAPHAVPNMAYSLAQTSKEDLGFSGGPEIVFAPGDQGGEYVIPRLQRFAGRILVDDPKQLASLNVQLIKGIPGEAGSIYYNMELEHPSGQYRSRPVEDAVYTVVVKVGSTFEEVGMMANLRGVATSDGDELRIPALDLRGKLFSHHLRVTTSDGTIPAEVSLRLSHEKDVITTFAPADYPFVSKQTVIQMTVGARGFRDQKVICGGDLNVVLQGGFGVQIDLDRPLPVADGIQWRAAMMEVRTPGQAGGISWDRIPWQEVQGKQLTFHVPHEGKWALLLRAVPLEGLENHGFSGIYSVRNDVVAVQVGEGDAKITTALNREELTRVISEAFAQEE